MISIRDPLPDLPERIEFELGWLALGFLIGVTYLAYQPSAALLLVLPLWAFYVWAAVFLLGTLLGIPGVIRSVALNPVARYWGHVGERAGLMLHMAACSTLAIAAVYIWLRGQAFPVVTVSLTAVWMAVALRRIVRVNQIIHEMTEPEQRSEE